MNKISIKLRRLHLTVSSEEGVDSDQIKAIDLKTSRYTCCSN